MTANPYKAPAEASGDRSGWTLEGNLVADRTTKKVTLPRICYFTGKTSDLVDRELSLTYFVCGNWIVPVTVLSILTCATALTAKEPAGRAVTIGGMMFYGLICFLCRRRIEVAAYESYGLARIRRRKLWRFVAAVCAIGIPLGIGGVQTVELPLPFVPMVGIALTGWYAQHLRGLFARPISGGLFQISGFCDQFHVERDEVDPMLSVVQTQTE